ncbi:hypothetical protein [Mucilaginibacter sp. L196]|uniref:hypothetical protein n=1 Tax=Mucilaginibacter sp. L196 TaxID=1641870 RepID=UPI00131B50E6|nr:hypothetical protein [Mucilaginibacter sp. L196]
MKKTLFLLLIISANAAHLRAQDTAAIRKCIQDNLPAVKLMVENKIIRSKARYMEEGNPVSFNDKLPGYEGIPVSLYHYHYPKSRIYVAYVYLLDADAERMARWLISSAFLVRGHYQVSDIKILLDTIDGQSNAQFPVAGIVFENDNDSFSSKFIYFKDGVTVSVKPAVKDRFKFDTLYTDTAKKTIKQITFSPANLSLMTNENLARCWYKGRIISTTRKEYTDAGGKENVTGFNFMRVVRDEYLKALTSDFNFLIYARARDLLK